MNSALNKESQERVSLRTADVILIMVFVVNIIIVGPMAWTVNRTLDDFNQLRNEVSDFKSLVAKTYVTNARFESYMSELRTMYLEILKELGDKEDRKRGSK